MFRLNEKNLNTVATLCVFFVCYSLLVIIATRPVYSFDGYWHLQMGKDFIENGLSPWVDHYSFSHLGNEISTVPVIFQTVLYKFVSAFGESRGFYFFKVFYLTLIMSVLYVYFKHVKAHWSVVFILLPVIAYFIHLRLMIRPEIFSNVLVVLCLLLYKRAQDNFVLKEMLWIFLLLLFWVNYHSPIMGYIIIFGLFFEKAISKYFYKDDTFSWRQWFVWGSIIFLIGFIRPNGQHFLFTVYNLMADDFGRYTQEYMHSSFVYSNNMLVQALWVLSSYVVVWSLIKKQYGYALVVALLTYFAWSTVRLVTVVVLTNLCVLAVYFSEYYYERGEIKVRSSVKKLLLIVALGVSVLAYYFIAKEAFTSMERMDDEDNLLEQRYPIQAVDYMSNYQQPGNILNVMEIGGYLLNKLSPEFKIYFDGRTNILYPIDFLKHSLSLLNDPDDLNKTIVENDVKYVLYRNTPENYEALNKIKSFELNFADESFILFSEEKRYSFPQSSMLLVFPSCWNEEWVPAISDEIVLAEEWSSEQNYDLKYVLAFMKDYLAHGEKTEFFAKLPLETLHSNGIRRVAMYLALRSGNADAALRIVKTFSALTEYDFLIFAYDLALSNEFVIAEDFLHYFYTMKKFVRKEVVLFENISIMIHVLDILEKNDALTKFEPAYKIELEEKLKKENFDMESTYMFNHICNAS